MASLIVVERALVKDGDQMVFRHKFDFATNYRVFEQTIVTMIAGSAISLHLLSRTITTKYRSALHKAASMDPIQHYVKTKNKWSDDEFALINWIAHGHSVRRFYHKKQFTVKFVHKWLPLGRLTSKYKKHHLPTCPTCSHEIEDGDHFLHCTKCPQWKLDMLRTL